MGDASGWRGKVCEGADGGPGYRGHCCKYPHPGPDCNRYRPDHVGQVQDGAQVRSAACQPADRPRRLPRRPPRVFPAFEVAAPDPAQAGLPVRPLSPLAVGCIQSAGNVFRPAPTNRGDAPGRRRRPTSMSCQSCCPPCVRTCANYPPGPCTLKRERVPPTSDSWLNSCRVSQGRFRAPFSG